MIDFLIHVAVFFKGFFVEIQYHITLTFKDGFED